MQPPQDLGEHCVDCHVLTPIDHAETSHNKARLEAINGTDSFWVDDRSLPSGQIWGRARSRRFGLRYLPSVVVSTPIALENYIEALL